MLAPRTLNGLLDITAIPSKSIPASARAMARLSLYDWFAVTRAGENEPVAKIVRGLVADEGGKEAASVAGLDKMVPARAAALANGAASHALDYDDTHFAHVGHPSVAILPAALAVAEEIDAPASAALDARTRANPEQCLLATRGKPRRQAKDVRRLVVEKRREHSRKPDCVRERIERLVGGPYLELFGRETKPGWDCWGNEAWRAGGDVRRRDARDLRQVVRMGAGARPRQGRRSLDDRRLSGRLRCVRRCDGDVRAGLRRPVQF